MAVLRGPLMSLSARGTIASTLTYAAWKGIPYARTRVVPANPQSVEQTKTRDVFRFLNDYYKFAPGIAREPWIAAVRGIPMTAQNMVQFKNVFDLRDAVTLDDMTLSPGAAGGIPPSGIVVTPGNDQISVAVSVPSAPTGWTLTAAQGVVLREQDPHATILESPTAVEDLTSTYTLVFTGLANAQTYQIGVWLKWLTTNQSEAYSIALRDTALTT
jgi:hypothetical protein